MPFCLLYASASASKHAKPSMYVLVDSSHCTQCIQYGSCWSKACAVSPTLVSTSVASDVVDACHYSCAAQQCVSCGWCSWSGSRLAWQCTLGRGQPQRGTSTLPSTLPALWVHQSSSSAATMAGQSARPALSSTEVRLLDPLLLMLPCPCECAVPSLLHHAALCH